MFEFGPISGIIAKNHTLYYCEKIKKVVFYNLTRLSFDDKLESKLCNF